MDLEIKEYEKHFQEDVFYQYDPNTFSSRKATLKEHLISYFKVAILQDLDIVNIIVPQDYNLVDYGEESPYWHYGHNCLVSDLSKILGENKIKNEIIIKEI